MRLIDADALMEKEYSRLREGEVLHCIPPSHVDAAPTIDAVPVVRCRECKHGKRGVDNMVRCSHPCGKVISMTADDFCSYGQRKEDEHEVSE